MSGTRYALLIHLAVMWALLALGTRNTRAADIDQWSLCMGGGGAASAVQACSKIVDSGGELPDSLPYAYVYRGRANLSLNQVDAAFADFTAALKSVPQLAHAHFGLGQIFEAREDWTHAAAEYAMAAGSVSEDADIDDFTADSEGSLRAESFTQLGYARFRKGDLQQALTYLSEAIKLCPTCSAPFRDQALVFDMLQRGPEAADAADRAIAQNPRSGAAFLVRGLNKARAGQFAAAITDYDEAIRLAPGLVNAYKARANAVSRLGHSAAVPGPAAPNAKGPVGGSQVTLGEDELKKLLAGRDWQAHQGPWLASLDFRVDGTFHQLLKDSSQGSHLAVAQDGAWGVSRGELCIYTNIGLCLTAHTEGASLTLERAGQAGHRAAQEVTATGIAEYTGALSDLRLHTTQAAPGVAELPVEEVLWRAPAAAGKGPKTLFYYMHGFDGRARRHSPLPEYFVSELRQSRGWDIIDGNYPRSRVTEIRRFGAANYGAAVFLARRLKELKAQGYQRIYVGGQSWGGWNSLILDTMPDLPLDGVVLVVPACCGWRFTGADHEDPNYANNKIFFDQMIQRARYPTVAVFFLGDEYEPADRGMGAATALTAHGVANLIIDHPPGFQGHGSAWFPTFDYLYGSCIGDFLESPHTGQCPRRRIAMDAGDFRAIVLDKQLAKRQLRPAGFSDLKGRQFAVYPQGEIRRVVDADQTEVRGYGIGSSTQPSTFRGAAYCIRGRVKYDQPENTNEVCVRLMKWSEDELLGFDPQSGRVLQWWVTYP